VKIEVILRLCSCEWCSINGYTGPSNINNRNMEFFTAWYC